MPVLRGGSPTPKVSVRRDGVTLMKIKEHAGREEQHHTGFE
jgi:hypothetical protein